MNKEEMLKKCEYYINQKLTGIFVIQERKLHDSGYRLMNVIGHSKYDDKINDFHYYLLSTCSDVIDFNEYLKNIPIKDLHIDINRNGIIHIWSNINESFICTLTNCSSCMLEKVGERNE